jgi:hypothetical protein
MSRAVVPSAPIPREPSSPSRRDSPWTWPLAAGWAAIALLKLVPWASGSASPPSLVASIAVAEAAVALALVAPVTRHVASVASALLALLLLVGGSLPIAVVTALEHQCGCLGPKLHLELAERRALAALLLCVSCLALRGRDAASKVAAARPATA